MEYSKFLEDLFASAENGETYEETDERYRKEKDVILEGSVRLWDTKDAILHTPDPRDSERQFEYGSTTFP